MLHQPLVTIPSPSEEIPWADAAFLAWLKRPVKMTKKKAERLIDDIDELIRKKRQQINETNDLREKNVLRIDIEHELAHKKWAETFLTDKK